jgi:hypothetical protein
MSEQHVLSRTRRYCDCSALFPLTAALGLVLHIQVVTLTMLTLLSDSSLNLSHCNPIRNTVMYASGSQSEKNTVLYLQAGVGG